MHPILGFNLQNRCTSNINNKQLGKDYVFDDTATKIISTSDTERTCEIPNMDFNILLSYRKQ